MMCEVWVGLEFCEVNRYTCLFGRVRMDGCVMMGCWSELCVGLKLYGGMG